MSTENAIYRRWARNFNSHSRVQLVMRYAHPTEEHQFNAIRKMEAYRVAKG
ncbi:MAG TPA: hypothetical protein VFG99_03785 [Chloroflexia bacterium]|nr:hypothetical protein [Chloroflexia bacterium]